MDAVKAAAAMKLPATQVIRKPNLSTIRSTIGAEQRRKPLKNELIIEDYFP